MVSTDALALPTPITRTTHRSRPVPASPAPLFLSEWQSESSSRLKCLPTEGFPAVLQARVQQEPFLPARRCKKSNPPETVQRQRSRRCSISLIMQKLDSISKQIVAWANKSEAEDSPAGHRARFREGDGMRRHLHPSSIIR